MNSGFSKENIIIFDENKVDDFKNLDIDVIYTCGGNTFTLLKLIKDCGFDKEIKKYVENGVIYIGRSAGSHLVSKNIEHVLPFDDNYIGLRTLVHLKNSPTGVNITLIIWMLRIRITIKNIRFTETIGCSI